MAKMKFDFGRVKRWLIDHGEKVAFGVMVCVFLMFVYSALRQEVLEDKNQPEQLKKMASEVRTFVTNSTWDQKQQGLQLVEYDKRAKRELIPEEPYKLPVPINNPLADPKVRRGLPELLPMEEWRVAAGSGIFSLRAEGGADKGPAGGGGNAAIRKGEGLKPSSGARLKAQSWAVVTALIPYDKQVQEFGRVYENAMAANKDTDVPHYVNVELERAEVNPSAPDKLDWQKVPADAVKTYEKDWEVVEPDIVANEYLDPALTYHLGPLVGADWDTSVVHPKIPLGATPQPGTQAPPAAGAAAAKAAEAPAFNGYRLLRVFDYSALPKHMYRYRITVAVKNPNFGLAPQFLEKPDSASAELLKIGPSGPSEPILVPGGHRVLLGSVKMAREPSAMLMLIAVDQRAGIEASTDLTVWRGSVANAARSVVYARDPRTSRVVELSDVDFDSGLVVMDIRGGRPIKRDTTSPGEVLLMDDGGNLILRDELDDEAAYAHSKPPEEPDEAGKSAEAIPGSDPKSKKATAGRPAKASGR